MHLIALPSRKDQQSLDGYVLVHLRVLELELLSGVPYRALVSALIAAGFATVTLRSIRSAMYRARKRRPSDRAGLAVRAAVESLAGPTPRLIESLPEAKNDRAAVGRLFRELARPPAIRGESPDLLI
jgi:hypothetical protein